MNHAPEFPTCFESTRTAETHAGLSYYGALVPRRMQVSPKGPIAEPLAATLI